MDTSTTSTTGPSASTTRIAFDRFRQYIGENPLKFAGTSILMWGMGLLLTFFLRIRYMPEVNLESVSSVLYAVAVLGLVISTYTMLALVAPGMLLASVKVWFGRFATTHLVCISFAAAAIWVLQLLLLFDIRTLDPLANVLCSAGIAIALCGAAFFWGWAKPPRVSNYSLLTPTSHRWSPQINSVSAFLASLAITSFIFGLLMISLLFIVVIGMGGDIRTASNTQAAFQLIPLGLLIAVSALAIGLSTSADKNKMAFIFAPTLLFLILIATGSFSSIPAMAMRALGQGEISAARIAVTGKVCREITQTLGQRVCAEAEESDVVAICPVMIKSRIGSQVVLEFAPVVVDPSPAQTLYWATTRNMTANSPGQALSRRVILDKAKMLSWQPLPLVYEKNITDASPAPPPIATSVAFGNEPLPKQGKQDPARVPGLLAQQCGAYFPPLAGKSDNSETE